MKDTRQIFFIGSGRCGTALIAQKLLPAIGGIEVYHEFKCEQVQEWGALKFSYYGFEPLIKNDLDRLYKSSVNYSSQPIWSDSSNKLSWLIKPMAQLFPDALWVHLIRSGPETVRSFYHKLEDESYTDRGVAALYHWIKSPHNNVIPPQTKEYWWPIPKKDDRHYNDFVWKWQRWERLCWYWATVNNVIEQDLQKHVEPTRRRLVRLEDLTRDGGETCKRMLYFLDLKWDDKLLPILGRPHNISFKMEYPEIDEWQMRRFDDIAGRVQEQYYG